MSDPTRPDDTTRDREVRYEHSLNLAPLLEHLHVTLLVSTYQAGKVVVVGARGGRPEFAFPSFDRAMGLAVSPGRLAVGTRADVWVLRAAPDVAAAGGYDAGYLARSAHHTGDIQGHEMAWAGDDLWVVNTRFSCLCTLDDRYSFVPRWRPSFVSALAAEDRCHLNGLAMDGGRPRFVTALGETDTGGGWRPNKATGGCLIDVSSGAVVARGLAMPHSPRVYRDRVWLLDSGRGHLATVDPATGRVEPVVELPGYARGLAFAGDAAFVGLSRARETATFGGLPIAARDTLKCGVAVVDLRAGRVAALLEFKSGVEEIFDVQVLPCVRRALLAGPNAGRDGTEPVWLVPT
jgi:uncharacterized protein (TIGR03032 family)